MNIKYTELCSADFEFTDIVAYKMSHDNKIEYNYETQSRVKHLIFMQLNGKRHYYNKERHICTLSPGDVLFLPHGAHYRSFITDENEYNTGIGISFNMISHKEAVFFDEDIMFFSGDKEKNIGKRFRRILYSVMNPRENVLRLKGEMYSLLDDLFAEKEKREMFDEYFKDIVDAINLTERHPERNMSVKELAEMCHMSESSFLRKFKEYSGGIAPVKYRNNIRFMLAEELASSPLTVNEIAERLGFYDGSHLCKMYKTVRGRTLKKITEV